MPGRGSKRTRGGDMVTETTSMIAAPTRRRGRDAVAPPGAEASSGSFGSSGNKKNELSSFLNAGLGGSPSNLNMIANNQGDDEPNDIDDGNDHVDDGVAPKSGPLSGNISSDSKKVFGDLSTGDNNATAADIARMRALLVHRKILLQRVKHGKEAAQKRLNFYVREDPTRNVETEEEEITQFRSLCQEATSMARKRNHVEIASAETGPSALTGKRTSLTLRRGGSVGKRMNAAISSLVTSGPTNPTSNSLAAGESSSAAIMSQSDSAIGMKGAVPDFQVCSGATAPVLSQNSGVAPSSRPSSTIPGGVKRDHSQLSRSTSISRVANTSSSAMTTMASSVSSGTALKSVKKGVAGSLGATSSTPGLVSGSAFGPNRKGLLSHLHRTKQPSVVIPEAAALREKRNEIRAKLNGLVRKRKDQFAELLRGMPEKSPESTHGSPSSPSHVHSSSPGHARAVHRNRASREFQRAALFKCPDAPSKLPPRRKANWDYLLEEMSWMATDFIEERKWKSAAARLISSSVASNDENKLLKGWSRGKLSIDKRDNTLAASLKSGAIEDSADPSNGGWTTHLDPTGVWEASRFRLYLDPRPEDTHRARKVAGSLCNLLADWAVSNPWLPPMSETHAKQNESETSRFVLTSEWLTKTRTFRRDWTSSWKESKEESMGIQDGEIGMQMRWSQHEIVERIALHIDQMTERISNVAPKLSPELSSRSKHGVDLNSTQVEIVGTVEDMWKRVKAGSILSGPSSSGKTVVACSLIWRARFGGPQLVVTCPASIIRWMHELGNFTGLRKVVLAHGTKQQSYREHDVVLCELAAVTSMEREVMKQFHSVIIDCRCPSGFKRSRKLSQMEPRSAAPGELSSSAWWSQFVVAASEGHMNRMIIDGPNPNLQSALDSLAKRQALEVEVLRLAFIFGTPVDGMPQAPIAKTLLVWGRRRLHKSQESGSKFVRMQRMFKTLLKPVNVAFPSSFALDEPFEHEILAWDVKKSKMTASQRIAYDNTCLELRATLSQIPRGKNSHSYDSDDFASFSSAILRLRHQCLHADTGKVLQQGLRQTGCGDRCKNFYRWGLSPSQPCFDLARDILTGSGKFQELLVILAGEIGIPLLHDVSVLSHLLHHDADHGVFLRHGNRVEQSGKRIAIIAVLPEAQILISLLLSAVGIAHELLLRPSSVLSERKLRALTWLECQVVLSRFNNRARSGEGVTRIIIASPATVAGDHGGLGVDEADVIISLDEDWSGRQEILIRSMMSRCTARKSSNSSGTVELVRIIAADSCEDSFLFGLDAAPRNLDILSRTPADGRWPWPISIWGVFACPPLNSSASCTALEVDMPTRRLADSSIFLFPAVNILRLRGCNLTRTLKVSKRMPALLDPSSGTSFLGRDDVEDFFRVQAIIVSRLILDEERMCPLHLESCTSIDLVSPWALAPLLPPMPHDFPCNMVSGENSIVAGLRVFHDRWGESYTVDANFPPLTLPSEFALMGSLQASDQPIPGVEDSGQVYAKAAQLNALSFLFYKSDSLRSEPLASRTRGVQSSINKYSALFGAMSCSESAFDGNQGCEAFVYFPLLFPLLQQSAMMAKRTLDSQRYKASENRNSDGQSGSKRKSQSFVTHPDSKRTRPDRTLLPDMDAVGLSNGIDASSMIYPGVTNEDDPSHRSEFRDPIDDFGIVGIGALPLPEDGAVAAANTLAVTSSLFGCDIALGEAILGSYSPIDAEEIEDISMKSAGAVGTVLLFVPRKRQRTRPNQMHPYANSMFSAPDAAGVFTDFPNGIFHEMNGSNKQKSKLLNQLEGSKNQVDSSIEASRELTQQSRTIISQEGAIPHPTVKGSTKHHLLLSLRQAGTGATLFESPKYRVASILVSKRVNDRILLHELGSRKSADVGPGVPLFAMAHMSNMQSSEARLAHWTSIFERTLDTSASKTNSQVERSVAQHAALRRSLNAPCRVDFGPFQAGFLSSPAGMTLVVPPRPRPGISLPMGVKSISIVNDQANNSWKEEEDKQLIDTVSHHGANFILAARVLVGFVGTSNVSHNSTDNGRATRAARGCRERWQVLAQRDPSIAKQAQVALPIYPSIDEDDATEEMDEESRKKKIVLIPLTVVNNEGDEIAGTEYGPRTDPKSADAFQLEGPDLSELDPMQMDPTELDVMQLDAIHLDSIQVDESLEDLGVDPSPLDGMQIDAASFQPHRSFASFHAAKAKKRSRQDTIPGVTPGTPPSVVPSHPSHAQAVQFAISNSWPSNSRSEMWPLQLLEAADNQRAAVAANSAATVAPSVSTLPLGATLRPPSSSSGRTQGSSSSANTAVLPSLAGNGQAVHRSVPAPPATLPSLNQSLSSGSPSRATPQSRNSNGGGNSVVSSNSLSPQPFAPPPSAVAGRSATTTTPGLGPAPPPPASLPVENQGNHRSSNSTNSNNPGASPPTRTTYSAGGLSSPPSSRG